MSQPLLPPPQRKVVLRLSGGTDAQPTPASLNPDELEALLGRARRWVYRCITMHRSRPC
jgi:flagellar biosynthesis protein